MGARVLTLYRRSDDRAQYRDDRDEYEQFFPRDRHVLYVLANVDYPRHLFSLFRNETRPL